MPRPLADSPPNCATSRGRDWYAWAAIAILTAAGLARYGASLGDFWLDEIWAWYMARDVKTSWSILTELHHDNNHYLYTWFMHLLGADHHWTFYRLPSVIAGVGTVFVAGLIGGRSGRFESFTAMLLTAGSYLQVYYSSEARGYGCVIFFGLLSFYLLDRSLRGTRPRNDLGFALVAILGFLSHLQFVFCYAGCLAWSLWRLNADSDGRRLLWVNLRCHILPLSFVSWLYYVDISKLRAGGADVLSVDRVLVELLSMTIGGPASGWIASIVAALVGAATIAGLVFVWRRGSSEWVFHVATIIISPIIISIVMQQEYVYPRHFLVCAIFILLLLNHALVRLAVWQPAGRVVVVVLLVAFLGANAVQIGRLLEVGRGQYRKALLTINEQTPTPSITIGSDNLVRNGTLLQFYQGQLPKLKPIEHFVMHPLPGNEEVYWPGDGPQWVLLHLFEQSGPAYPTFTDPFGNTYRLEEEYPYAGPSGWKWAVYRNENG
jgi:hypothetical protein